MLALAPILVLLLIPRRASKERAGDGGGFGVSITERLSNRWRGIGWPRSIPGVPGIAGCFGGSLFLVADEGVIFSFLENLGSLLRDRNLPLWQFLEWSKLLLTTNKMILTLCSLAILSSPGVPAY